MLTRRIVTGLILVFGVTQRAGLSAAESSAELAYAAARDVHAKVRSSAHCLADWAEATVNRPDLVETPQGKWWVATVSTPAGPAGYVLLAETADGVAPVMYSRSPVPMPLVRQARAASITLPVDPVVQFDSCVEAPMIAVPTSKYPGLRVSPLACCIASLGLWVQAEYRLPLFYNLLESIASRPFDLASERMQPAPDPRFDELTAFYEAMSTVFRDPQLNSPLPPSTSGPIAISGPPGTYISDIGKLYERLRPIIDAQLLKSMSQKARWTVMQEEYLVVSQMLVFPHTNAMSAAAVMETYLTGHPLEDGLERFMTTRVLKPSWSVERVTTGEAIQAPCVLVNPDGWAVLVVAVQPGKGDRWCIAVAPDTVKPEMVPLQQFEQELASKYAGIRSRPSSEPDLPPYFDDPEIRRQFEKDKRESEARHANEKVMRDRFMQADKPVVEGGHVARTSLFEGWQMVRWNGSRASSSTK